MNNVNRLNETTVEIDGDTYELKKKAFTLRPSEGDEYFSFHIDGDILKSDWRPLIHNDEIYQFGNVFKTKEEAKLELSARIKERELTDFIAELNHREGWVCDWSDLKQQKACFDCFSVKKGKFLAGVAHIYKYRPASHYFKPELEQEIRAKFSHDDLRLIYCRERS